MVLRPPGLGVLTGRRLAVWGDPIDHSISPRVHAAAYRVLGLDWEYGRERVDEASFAARLAALGERWRGLSLTMPLKGVAFAAAETRDRSAELTGAVNTLLLEPGGPRGFNTDVGGIVRALAEEGVAAAARARIVGAGATATSALVALWSIGAREVEVVARRTEAVTPLRGLGERLGVTVTAAGFDAPRLDPVDLTVATLPGGATVTDAAAAALAASGGPLLDVVYGHWPTVLSQAWERAGATAWTGAGMLLHQAVLQVRVFTQGDPAAVLPAEDDVVAAMRSALVGD
ncbi:shikimate dehydrogenase [Microbacterium sp. BWT-B31]|uniref:shikimate dehydrogenase n=1 Tax=Microbacterium sp. BWT-B31 TaxID=3232072 RepID=UPI00352952EF